jgi:hypothetical protein
LYDFEEFTGGVRGTTTAPRATLQTRGYLSVNKAAFELMGSPNAVKLHYDRKQQVIGLQPVADTVANGKRLRVQAKSTTRVVSLRAFCTYYGIDATKTYRYPATLYNGYLTVDLKAPKVEVARKRVRRKRPKRDGTG